MNKICLYRSAALALALAAGGAATSPAFAQEVAAQPLAATNPDADSLAVEMRVLAESPRDLEALLRAGNLSARLGDGAAALAFFARAETVEPSNPRILSGRAAVLVRLERPGEALRLFQAAEARGVPAREHAADRGLAYDLLGAPQLAQKDYRLALAGQRDDETVRRYALSLGIAGRPEEAMAELDSLLRKSDRASWRARAFILAMNGDIAGAEKIAASMMPGSMGAGLLPFFRRLEGLSVASRAYAVHFGELSPTQARLADARMAPPVEAYVPEPKPVAVPVQFVAATPAPQPAAPGSRGKRASRRDQALAPAARAAVVPQPEPVQVAAANPLPPPPAFVPPPMIQPIPAPSNPRPVEVTVRPGETAGDADLEARPVTRTARRDLRPRPEPKAPGPARIGEEDSVLASIIKGITVPESEREAVAAPAETPAPEPVAEPQPVRIAAAKPVAAKPERAKPETPKPKTPPKPDPKKAEPARVWVQVAGGANEKTLPTTWRKLAKSAPAAFKGKSAWTTPLRATNRLLAGPFKNGDAAQDFVNALRKNDISAFVFTSEAGQKIAKLAVQ